MLQKLKPRSYKPKPSQTGSVIVFAVLLLAVMLAIVFSLSAVFIPKILLSAKAKSSVSAFYAADSAVEWCLYTNQKGSTNLPVMSNGAAYYDGDEKTLDARDCDTSPVKVIGTYQSVSRAIEVSF